MFHKIAYVRADNSFFVLFFRWSGGSKVSCILRHSGDPLILAYSWARPAIFVAGKGRGNVFISSVYSLSFLFLFLPCPFHLFYYLFYLFTPFLCETKQNDPQGLRGRLSPTQEVAESTPPRLGNILSWRLIMKYFLQSFSPTC